MKNFISKLKLNYTYKRLGFKFKKHVPLTPVQENWYMATATEEELRDVEETMAKLKEENNDGSTQN
jgi:hypothetical protein